MQLMLTLDVRSRNGERILDSLMTRSKGRSSTSTRLVRKKRHVAPYAGLKANQVTCLNIGFPNVVKC